MRRRIKFAVRDRLLFIETLLTVIATTILLRVTSFRVLERYMPGPGVQTAPPSFEFRLARSIAAASHWVPGASCLRQALAAQFMLARRGFVSTIQVGVALDPSQTLKAHAWLLSGDRIITGGPEDEIARYAPLTQVERYHR